LHVSASTFRDITTTTVVYINSSHTILKLFPDDNMLLLLMVAFLAITTACPPPLNSFKYLANDTHTTSEMISSLILPRNQSSTMNCRWTDIVTMVSRFATLQCYHMSNQFKDWRTTYHLAQRPRTILFRRPSRPYPLRRRHQSRMEALDRHDRVSR
jgi:hypothetical protein